MKLMDSDVEWLRASFPSLVYDQNAQRIIGELDFCACFDSTTNRVRIEGLERDDTIRNSDSVICDVFEIEIRLDANSVHPNGWPKVFEVGGRANAIAKKCCVKKVDLHVNSYDDSCCLGIRFAREKNLTIDRFLYELVIPFLFRLSYTDQFGIEAARNDLWGEYSHGDLGLIEHARNISHLASHKVGRNGLCPCGSGAKYKNCCLGDVQAVARAERSRH